MTIDAKSSLILLATLLLGIAIGALGAGALSHLRGEHLRELRHPGGFVQYMEGSSSPGTRSSESRSGRDETQRERLETLFDELGFPDRRGHGGHDHERRHRP